MLLQRFPHRLGEGQMVDQPEALSHISCKAQLLIERIVRLVQPIQQGDIVSSHSQLIQLILRQHRAIGLYEVIELSVSRCIDLLRIDIKGVVSNLKIISGKPHTALDIVISHVNGTCDHLAKRARITPDPISPIEVTEGVVVRIGHLEWDSVSGGEIEDYQLISLKTTKTADTLIGELRLINVGFLPIPGELIVHQRKSERGHR